MSPQVAPDLACFVNNFGRATFFSNFRHPWLIRLTIDSPVWHGSFSLLNSVLLKLKCGVKDLTQNNFALIACKDSKHMERCRNSCWGFCALGGFTELFLRGLSLIFMPWLYLIEFVFPQYMSCRFFGRNISKGSYARLVIYKFSSGSSSLSQVDIPLSKAKILPCSSVWGSIVLVTFDFS